MTEEYPPVECPYCGAPHTWDAQLIKQVNICKACNQPFRVSGDGSSMPAGDYDLNEDDEPASRAAAATAAAARDYALEGDIEVKLDQERGYKTCPSCDSALPIHNKVCQHCGYNYDLGGKQSTAFDRNAVKRKPPRLALRDICRMPFRGDAMAEAVTTVALALLWMMVVMVVLLGVIVARFVSPGLFALSLVGLFAVGMILPALVASRYTTIAEQYEQGSIIGQSETTRVAALGYMMWHSLVAAAPLVAAWVFALLAPGALLDYLAGWLGVTVALAYWFMGVAMAGAYGTLNPLDVLKSVYHFGMKYVFVLLYTVPLIALAWAVGVIVTELVASWFLSFARQGGNVAFAERIASMLRTVVMIPFAQFGIFAGLAMVGSLLRRERVGSEGEPNEYGKAMVYPLSTLAAAVAFGLIAALVTGMGNVSITLPTGGGGATTAAPTTGPPYAYTPSGAASASTTTTGGVPVKGTVAPGGSSSTTAGSGTGASSLPVIPPVGDDVATLPAVVDLSVSSLLPLNFDGSQAGAALTRAPGASHLIDEGIADVATRGVATTNDNIYAIEAQQGEVWVRYMLDYTAANNAFNLERNGKDASGDVVLYTSNDGNIHPHAVVILRPTKSMWIYVDRKNVVDVRRIALLEMERRDQMFIYFRAPSGVRLDRMHVGNVQWAVRPVMTVK